MWISTAVNGMVLCERWPPISVAQTQTSHSTFALYMPHFAAADPRLLASWIPHGQPPVLLRLQRTVSTPN